MRVIISPHMHHSESGSALTRDARPSKQFQCELKTRPDEALGTLAPGNFNSLSLEYSTVQAKAASVRARVAHHIIEADQGLTTALFQVKSSASNSLLFTNAVREQWRLGFQRKWLRGTSQKPTPVNDRASA